MHAGSLWSARPPLDARPKRFLTGGMPGGRQGRGTMAGVEHRDAAASILARLAGMWRACGGLASWRGFGFAACC